VGARVFEARLEARSGARGARQLGSPDGLFPCDPGGGHVNSFSGTRDPGAEFPNEAVNLGEVFIDGGEQFFHRPIIDCTGVTICSKQHSLGSRRIGERGARDFGLLKSKRPDR